MHPIYERCVIVPEEHLGAIANNSVDTYTSISIDNITGTAKPGALFAFEGVPRSSVFIFDVGFLNPDLQGVEYLINEKSSTPPRLDANFNSLIQIVESGLSKFEIMGIGGKLSRGFGQLKIIPVVNRVSTETIYEEEAVADAIRPNVFISHSSKDKMLVRRLAKDLQLRQINVWLDEREILVGDSLHRRISEGVQEADFLVLVLSQSAIKSGWVEREVNAGLMRELESNNVIVLPVLIDQSARGQIPVILHDRKYANMSKSYDEGLYELIYSIRGHQNRRHISDG